MRFAYATAAFAAGVCAYPGVAIPEGREVLNERAPVRDNEKNSGFVPNTEAGEFIDVRPGSGHEFQAPKSDEIRGPCPGLNSAANHGFISRTGILDFKDTTVNLPNSIGLGYDFATILFFFSIFNSGSAVLEKWSIGGPIKGSSLGVLAGGRGISNSHNKYDGDASPGRGDAYLHDGDSHTLNIPNFSNLVRDPEPDGTYTLASLRRQANRAHDYTIQNNPYGFFGPTFAVPPIAHQFIVTMMSNYSEPHIQGVLTKETLLSFFAVTEAKDGTLTWNPGHDRIPYNWYRRPKTNLYGTASSFGDFGITCAQTPQICDIGGNLGKPNTFVGIDIHDLTGGAFNAKTLLQGNNLGCLALESLTFAVPGLANTLLEGATKIARDFQNLLGSEKSKLGCPQLTQYNTKKFNRYPGFTWQQPLQPDTPY